MSDIKHPLRDHPFIDDLHPLRNLKQSELLGRLRDNQWLQTFTAADESGKHFLASQWVAVLERFTGSRVGKDYGNVAIMLFDCRDIITALQPYFTPELFKSEDLVIEAMDLTGMPIDLPHILAGAPSEQKASKAIRAMWFGDQAASETALVLRASNVEHNDMPLTFGNLTSWLAVRVATAPNASKAALTAACLMCYRAGFLLNEPMPEMPDVFKAWQYLGLYTKGANHFQLRANASESQRANLERIRHLPQFVQKHIQDSPIEVLAKVFPIALPYASSWDLKAKVRTAAMLGNILPQPSPAIEVLAAWAPAYAERIRAAQSMGMDLTATLAWLSTAPDKEIAGTSVELPNLA